MWHWAGSESMRTQPGKGSALLWYRTKLQMPFRKAFVVLHVTSRRQLRIKQPEELITLFASSTNAMCACIYFKYLKIKANSN